ncbi:MAG: hypothetical protein AAB445_00030 [Patescibacteria group bacterium]
MSRRILLIIAGALLLALLALGVFFFLQRRDANSNTNASNTNGNLPNVNTVVLNTNQAGNSNTAVNGSALTARAIVESTARSFASIYGSFSNQNSFENITSLYPLMAPALKAQQEAFVGVEQAKRADTSLYTGFTSEPRIVNVEAFDENDGTAEVRVTLQRTETSGSSTESTTYFQDITLSFQRLDGAWKVWRLAWGAKQ